MVIYAKLPLLVILIVEVFKMRGFGLSLMSTIILWATSGCVSVEAPPNREWTRYSLYEYNSSIYTEEKYGPLRGYTPVYGEDFALLYKAINYLNESDKKECQNFELSDHYYFTKYDETSESKVYIEPIYVPEPGNITGVQKILEDGQQLLEIFPIEGARQLDGCFAILRTTDQGASFVDILE